jgi:hypothetical protein
MEQGLVWEGVVRKIIAIAGIVGLSLCWAVMPAGAGNSPHFDSTPSSGPPGTVIHASDTNFNCDQPGANVVVKLIAGEVVIAQGNTTVDADSTWAVDVTVPSDAVPGEDTLTAKCTDNAHEFSVFYANNSFTVTAVVATTTTTTTTAPAPTTTTTTVVPVIITPATTPTTVAPPVPTAPAAAPVVASPALTG